MCRLYAIRSQKHFSKNGIKGPLLFLQLIKLCWCLSSRHEHTAWSNPHLKKSVMFHESLKLHYPSFGVSPAFTECLPLEMGNPSPGSWQRKSLWFVVVRILPWPACSTWQTSGSGNLSGCHMSFPEHGDLNKPKALDLISMRALFGTQDGTACTSWSVFSPVFWWSSLLNSATSSGSCSWLSSVFVLSPVQFETSASIPLTCSWPKPRGYWGLGGKWLLERLSVPMSLIWR